MPRRPREKSTTGIYHIMIRGINKEDIFHDDDDYRMFLHILSQVAQVCSHRLLAYCLMKNHVHLLIKDNDNLSDIMKRIGTRYAHWYNKKYNRIGHVFQDRFKSEKVETERYLLTVLRYIHHNPIKANIVDNIYYPWSSHKSYVSPKKNQHPFVDTDLILSILSDKKAEAIDTYRNFMSIVDEEANCLEYDNELTNEVLERKIIKLLGGYPLETLSTMEVSKRNSILRKAKKINGASIRKIAEVTGLNRNMVSKA